MPAPLPMYHMVTLPAGRLFTSPRCSKAIRYLARVMRLMPISDASSVPDMPDSEAPNTSTRRRRTTSSPYPYPITQPDAPAVKKRRPHHYGAHA